ncbi:TerB family tellurite resistance protein [Actinomadura bangladeshensis]|uniref:TerB family tellurite resistance protein n=1 Tax=Actinomadura bangladeshensis TaxID=453573 RepID=UPI002442A5F5|nr:TerB family tellurite resistance protein [Actinomadura bangladeshensis]
MTNGSSFDQRRRPRPASRAGDPAEARAAIQIGIIIGGADGNFDSSEKAAVREACFAVGGGRAAAAGTMR